ncbi:hypothetical protein ZWY2020_042497 [Hordeum vulgare]|nr:hypothetical protein ZWY2020_042497 [Hordeum vulgare]
MDPKGLDSDKSASRLYVGNLDFRISESDVIKMFSPYGKIIAEDFLLHTRYSSGRRSLVVMPLFSTLPKSEHAGSSVGKGENEWQVGLWTSRGGSPSEREGFPGFCFHQSSLFKSA